MLGRFCCRSILDAHVGNDGGYAAALLQSFCRLRTRKGGFDNLSGRSSKVVFRAQGDDRAAAMKYVANELEGRASHHTGGVHTQSNVVNRLAAMYRFRNH